MLDDVTLGELCNEAAVALAATTPQPVTSNEAYGPVSELYRTALEKLIPRILTPDLRFDMIDGMVEEMREAVDDHLGATSGTQAWGHEALWVRAVQRFFMIMQAPLHSIDSAMLETESTAFAFAARRIIFNPPPHTTQPQG